MRTSRKISPGTHCAVEPQTVVSYHSHIQTNRSYLNLSAPATIQETKLIRVNIPIVLQGWTGTAGN